MLGNTKYNESDDDEKDEETLLGNLLNEEFSKLVLKEERERNGNSGSFYVLFTVSQANEEEKVTESKRERKRERKTESDIKHIIMRK